MPGSELTRVDRIQAAAGAVLIMLALVAFGLLVLRGFPSDASGVPPTTTTCCTGMCS